MQREREGMNEYLRGFGSNGRMLPSIFGGRNPFDDPFFARPFHSLFDSNMFSPRAISSDTQERPREKGIVIEELDSDQEEEDNERENSKSSNVPSVEHPDDDDDDDDGTKHKRVTNKNEPYEVEPVKPQKRSYSVHTCKVTYGGVDGAYYTSATTRKSGSDGVIIEETKEADRTTGLAQHRISRGIHDKGHSVTRKRNADGKVETSQTLHNLDEDELAGFEESWKSNYQNEFPGWNHRFDIQRNTGPWDSEQHRGTTSRSWFLPSSQEMHTAGGTGSEKSAGGRTKSVVRINIE